MKVILLCRSPPIQTGVSTSSTRRSVKWLTVTFKMFWIIMSAKKKDTSIKYFLLSWHQHFLYMMKQSIFNVFFPIQSLIKVQSKQWMICFLCKGPMLMTAFIHFWFNVSKGLNRGADFIISSFQQTKPLSVDDEQPYKICDTS